MNFTLTEKISKLNYNAFIWHGAFLSLASNFMDVHTVIPSLLIKAGGNSILLGLLTAIMVGGSGLMQIFFAKQVAARQHKKTSLLLGINLRVISLFLLSLLLLSTDSMSKTSLIISIFALISLFSFSGSYAGISYVDVMGKSILGGKRKQFFSVKQTISSIGIFISAFLVKSLLQHYSYPDNYSLLFLLAGGLLFIASLGFWKIKEITTDKARKYNLKQYFQQIPQEIAGNSNLKNYLIVINNLGLGLSFIPFMILFAKQNFELSYNLIGNILIFKITGMLITGFILYKKSHNFDYKRLLYFSLVIGAIIPLSSLIFSHSLLMFKINFFISGIFITSYGISKSGILVEISDNENRAVYTGISGAGNILPTIFPLAAGLLISLLGYTATFILVSMIISSSFIFITKLDCKNLILLKTK